MTLSATSLFFLRKWCVRRLVVGVVVIAARDSILELNASFLVCVVYLIQFATILFTEDQRLSSLAANSVQLLVILVVNTEQVVEGVVSSVFVVVVDFKSRRDGGSRPNDPNDMRYRKGAIFRGAEKPDPAVVLILTVSSVSEGAGESKEAFSGFSRVNVSSGKVCPVLASEEEIDDVLVGKSLAIVPSRHCWIFLKRSAAIISRAFDRAA